MAESGNNETVAMGAPAAPANFLRRFLDLAGPYWSTEERWRARALAGALVALTIAQVFVPIMINLWSAQLFDSLEQRSMDRFLLQIAALGVILVVSMVITGTHMWVKRRIQLDWRHWLTRRLAGAWMAGGRHFQITHMPGEHDNPDGRIAEDVRNATEAAIDLAHSLVYCVLLLVSFTRILWSLSGVVTIEIAGTVLQIPGHMVGIAMLYAGAGTAAAMLVGRPLVRAVNKRQTFEANFRFGLVRARENSEAIALIHGESDERRRILDLFRGIERAWNRQTAALARIFLFTSGYSVLSTAFPILVAAPRYIAGSISLGELMQTAQAFQQMAAALSWPVDNLARWAEWRASVERVLALADALQALEEDVEAEREAIRVEAVEGPSLIFQDVCVANPDGEVMVLGFNAEISPGERVLISGDPGAAVKLFKVVAGLWPWGQGRVALPSDAIIFFMPQRPYLPIGPLGDAVGYPAHPGAFPPEEIALALERVGLPHLSSRLEESDAWERALTLGEQQRLGFARLLLHRPDWIFLQEATDALDPEGEEDMMLLLQDEFREATVITVGYHDQLEAFHQRKLMLVRSTNGLVLIKETHVRREAERAGGPAKREPSWRRMILDYLRRRDRRGD
ncbi:MAG: ABC transporter ATP-binding protein/permease [Actinomycetota bacterium]